MGSEMKDWNKIFQSKINNQKSKIFDICLFALLFIAFSALPVSAGAPLQINYQGKVSDSSGVPLDGTHNLQFKIFDEAVNGNELYDSTEVAVAVSHGVFNVIIGAAPMALITSDVFRDTADTWLEVTVNGTALTRQKLVASPYAFAVAADTIGTNEIIDASVNTNDLADNAVTSAKISQETITNADISPTAELSPDKINGGSFQAEPYTFPGTVSLPGGVDLNGGSAGAGTAIDFGPYAYDDLTAGKWSVLTGGPAVNADALHTHPNLAYAPHAHTHAPGSPPPAGTGTDLIDSYYLSFTGPSRTVTSVHEFNPAAPGAPFVLGANAQDPGTNFITGLNADLLDGVNSDELALSARTISPGTGLVLSAGTGQLDNDMTLAIDTAVVPRKGQSETITGEWTFSSSDINFPNGIWNTAGNVGIGTINPGAYRLNVNGPVNADEVCLSGDCRSSWPNTSLWVRNAGYISYTGNVGIGTSSPGYELDVNGQVNAETDLCIGADCRASWPWQTDTYGISFPSSVGNMGVGANAVSGQRLYVQGNLNVAGDVVAGSFAGNGVGITGLDADNITTGALPVARGGTGVSALSGSDRLVMTNASGTGLDTSVLTISDIATIDANGVNNDINELTGLSTPLSVSQGGTGGGTGADARTGLQAAWWGRTMTGASGLTGGGALSSDITLSLDVDTSAGCGTATTGKLWWNGAQLVCGSDQFVAGAITGSGAQNYLATWNNSTDLSTDTNLYLEGTTLRLPGDMTLTGTMDGLSIQNDSIDRDKIQNNSVGSSDVSFNYAGSSSKGGAANNLSCTTCVSSSEVSFNYAGSSSKGGAANNLSCTDCVSSNEVDFFYAASTNKGGGASDLSCSNCVSSSEVSFNYAGSNSKAGPATSISLDTPPTLCSSGQYARGINASGNAVCATDETNDYVESNDLTGLFPSYGILKRTGVNSFSVIADNSSNWDTMTGWGDHDGLYSSSSHAHSYLPLSGGTMTGDLYATSIYARNTAATRHIVLWAGGSFHDLTSHGAALTINHWGNTNVLFNAAGSGNVGIGTDSPNYKLHLNNHAGGNDHFLVVDSNGTDVFSVKAFESDVEGNIVINGSLTVNGWVNATVKNFEIDHPLDQENKKLVHSCLEGPEISVFYRGKAALVNGKAVVHLPDYFEKLTRKKDRSVLLTCVKGVSPLFVQGEVENGRFEVRTNDKGDPNQAFYWEVKAVRADVNPLKVEKDKS